ncbi:pyridoxal phosphate-dependent aminotransferase [Methanothermobacter wolfeii]|uniref:pyridoxal phosphate-dependent aminotransferase n=1 Tax=Methanothermobacter wolfeii TaxID=145261 RepID=UPI0024B3C5C6|nr:pyridoxal phosphate-dependent aminotransferase [Methanothermobacter wolfeii]MDI6702903.1 pyridoxal phosphate-dependent aminotransferase [Methanothermobacter wolfeii]MDI6841432.1 pyridoxal phosphate-dependent aminotransferase [Methanothermobacter wolfeii]
MISPKKYAKAAKVPPNGFKTTNEFFNYVFKDEEMIWMGQNTNHLHDHSEIAEAMIDCINEGNYCKYPPPEGFPELKELVVRDLGLGDGFEALITAGGTESLYLCMNDILEPEDNAITCDPGYLIIDNFASRFACSVISIPIYSRECGYKLTPELVLENMDRNTHMVSLIDPLNPLGSSYTKDEIKAFADIANDHDIYLLHDITYRDFAMDHHLAADYAPEKTVTVYSFSKICGMAGLRIGAIVATSDLIESIKSIVINDLGTNVISQAGAIAALRSKNRWVDRIRNTTFRNQKIIKDAVDEVDGAFIPVYPSSGNMMAIDIHKTGVDPLDLADYLLKRKIFVRQGAYTSRAFGDRYIRLSFSIPREQVEIFAENFVDVMEFLRPSN